MTRKRGTCIIRGRTEKGRNKHERASGQMVRLRYRRNSCAEKGQVQRSPDNQHTSRPLYMYEYRYLTSGRRRRLVAAGAFDATRSLPPIGAVFLHLPFFLSRYYSYSRAWGLSMGSRSRHGSPDFDRDRIRTRTARAGQGSIDVMLKCMCRRSFFRHSEATSNRSILAALILAFGLLAFGLLPWLFIQAACAGCHRSASHGANGHRPLAVSSIRIALPRGGGGVRRAACLLGF